MIGTYIGYILFIKLSSITSDGYYYLHTDEKQNKGWLGVFIVFLLFNSFVWSVVQGDINIPIVKKLQLEGLNENYNTSDKELNSKNKDNSYIYKKILSQINDYRTNIKINDIFNNDYNAIYSEYKNILNDNPDIFWLNGEVSASITTVGTMKTYLYKLGTSCDMRYVESMKKKMDLVVDNIVNEAMNYKTDYQKALFVHDKLVEECEYDINSFLITNANLDIDVNQMIFTAYGCLVEKKAVCSGYAKAYQLIMNKIGIECGYITGVGVTATGTDYHAWNYICIDGKYYYVDVTWDDPISSGYSSNQISHDYFAISKEEISKNHIFDKGQFVPE